MIVLYPLLFEPVYKSVLWGGKRILALKGVEQSSNNMAVGESWELCDLDNDVSVVCNGAWQGRSLRSLMEFCPEQLIGRASTNRYGNRFPLLIKLIDALQPLSIQVHPGGDSLLVPQCGKNEMWYIVEAAPDAHICLGFREPINRELYASIVGSPRITDYLNYIPVKSGDVFHIPAGTVHAIGAGCLIAEIQQPSDITYRIYDYDRLDQCGRKRSLHLNEALQTTRLDTVALSSMPYTLQCNRPVSLVQDPFFEVSLLHLNAVTEFDTEQLVGEDRCAVLQCVAGAVTITDAWANSVLLQQGCTALLPARTAYPVLFAPQQGGECTLLVSTPAL